jgi:Flp pilus assembly protein TadD
VPYNLGWFLKIALAPFPLSADYGFAYPESFWAVPNLLAWGSVTGLILLSVFFYQRTRSITFGVWWFLFTLTPVLNLIEIHNPITDRYLYLPLVGLVLSIAVVIQEHFEGFFPQTWPIRIIKYSIVPGIVLVYAVLTMVRNTEWKDEYRLWTTTVKYFPKSNTAHYNLGLVYIRQGLIEEAIREFQQAIAIRPGDIQAHNNLGFIYVHQGRLDDAIREFQTALAIHPDLMRGYDLVSVHNNLGLVYAQQGLVEESIREYQKALVIRPDDAETRNNLGIIYAQQGRFEEASREFQKVLAIQPDNANAYYNLGSVCMQQGRFEEAIREYQKALAIQPGYAEAHNNLGVIYAQQSHFEDAIREFQAALAIYPGYDDARNNLDRATASQKLLY